MFVLSIRPPTPHSGGLSDFQSPSLVGDLGGVPEKLLPTDSYLDSATPKKDNHWVEVGKLGEVVCN